MKTWRESTSVFGDSSLTYMLRKFLRDLDWRQGRQYPYDEIYMMQPWPKESLEFFLELGVIVEGSPDAPVFLTDCADPDWADPEWQPNLTTGKMSAIIPCGCEYCNVVHVVHDRERGYQWRPALHGVCERIAEAVGGEVTPIVPDRLFMVGSINEDGHYCELFVGCGLGDDDAQSIIAQAERLQSSPAAAILAMNKLPSQNLWSDRRPPVISLAETVAIKDMKFHLDLSPLLAQMAMAGEVSGNSWLTVSEAAELLTRDFPGLEIEAARARVSLAASREAFATNNQARRQRRIHAISFSAWRLKQRDKDLDAEDIDEAS